MNILLLSVGAHNKVIQYFKKEFIDVGNVVVTGLTEIASAIYEAGEHYQMSHAMEDDYVDLILNICKKEQIPGMLSLVDPELSLVVENKERFAKIGVTIIGLSYDLYEMALDKIQMPTWLGEHGHNYARNCMDRGTLYKDLDAGEISFPVFVKPVRGSASITINKVKGKETINLLRMHDGNLMVRKLLNGREIGGDYHIDMIFSKLVSVFTEKEILMRAGETDKAMPFKDEKLLALIERFVEKYGRNGQVGTDILDTDGKHYTSEVNPRFGGGYSYAYECSYNHMKLIESNLIGVASEGNIGAYEEGVYVMRYSEVMIRGKES